MSSGVASKKFIELAGPENVEGIMLPAGRLLVEGQLAASHPQKRLLGGYIKSTRTIPAAGLDVRRSRLGRNDDARPGDSECQIRRAGGHPGRRRKHSGLPRYRGRVHILADDHAGLSEEAFAMVRITKGDWELLR